MNLVHKNADKRGAAHDKQEVSSSSEEMDDDDDNEDEGAGHQNKTA